MQLYSFHFTNTRNYIIITIENIHLMGKLLSLSRIISQLQVIVIRDSLVCGMWLVVLKPKDVFGYCSVQSGLEVSKSLIFQKVQDRFFGIGTMFEKSALCFWPEAQTTSTTPIFKQLILHGILPGYCRQNLKIYCGSVCSQI